MEQDKNGRMGNRPKPDFKNYHHRLKSQGNEDTKVCWIIINAYNRRFSEPLLHVREDPYVRWCERRTPLVTTGEAAYSIGYRSLLIPLRL